MLEDSVVWSWIYPKGWRAVAMIELYWSGIENSRCFIHKVSSGRLGTYDTRKGILTSILKILFISKANIVGNHTLHYTVRQPGRLLQQPYTKCILLLHEMDYFPGRAECLNANWNLTCLVLRKSQIHTNATQKTLHIFGLSNPKFVWKTIVIHFQFLEFGVFYSFSMKVQPPLPRSIK